VIAYIARRLGLYMITFWAALTLNFLLPRLMPGSPTDSVIGKLQGRGVSVAAMKQLETALGVSHESLFKQYRDYLVNLAHFKFGVSVNFYPVPVSQLMRQALPWTLILVGTATVIAFVIGTLLGVLAGWRRNGAFDSVATTTGTFIGAFPFFWTGLLLTYVLSLKMGWFPISGGSDDAPSWSWGFLKDASRHAVLPALSIVIAGVGVWLIAMRNNMINVLGEDYVLFAQANGIRGRKIATSYAARNAILPNITALGIVIGSVVGGSLLVEIVFAYPGMGYLLFQAVTSNDYALMQAIFLAITVSVLVANLCVDLLYLALDPRVRR
jgi:peptide/nickel transport system permease protein